MNRLIIAGSEDNQDMYYATGFLALDPFIFIAKGKSQFIAVNRLEYARAKRQVKKGISVLRLENYKNPKCRGLSRIAVVMLKEMKIKEVFVPYDLPWKWGKTISRSGIRLSSQKPFFKKREVKSTHEIKLIKNVQRATEDAMKTAINMVKTSRPRGGYLYYRSKRLTSEMLKLEIRMALSRHGCIDQNTIVSNGGHSALPHHSGQGPIRAGSPVVIDIFPRSETNRYFSDMTRTVCKGKPAEEIKKFYSLVKKAQLIAMKTIRPGIKASSVHKAVVDFFTKYGVEKYFIHGTGHGVGLDIHESPNLGASDERLKKGMIITVEPGLYKERIGGVRLEDIVVVTKDGCRNLTKYRKELIL